ncbi:MAG TPA: hypothetical protein VFJ82_17290 [Longimicrobium sp.]|nr:hypothetical protein [Longimicrobium sp.]
MPPTQGGRLYRKILGVVWVLSIAGITLTLSSLASALMNAGLSPAQLGAKVLLLNSVLLAGGALMSWMAYRGNRRNLVPPTWGIVTLVALVWAGLLINRLA